MALVMDSLSNDVIHGFQSSSALICTDKSMHTSRLASTTGVIPEDVEILSTSADQKYPEMPSCIFDCPHMPSYEATDHDVYQFLASTPLSHSCMRDCDAVEHMFMDAFQMTCTYEPFDYHDAACGCEELGVSYCKHSDTEGQCGSCSAFSEPIQCDYFGLSVQ
jgi:hypothetical protein